MPIYKNEKNGSWFVKTYIKNKNGQSEQVTKRNKDWIGREGKLLAKQYEVKLQNKNQNEEKIDNNKITILELCNNYLNYISNNVRKSTYDRYANLINTYIIPHLKNKKANKLTNLDIIKWHNIIDECSYGKEEKELSIAYKRKIHSALSTVLNHGCKFYDIEKNVAHITGNFAYPRGSKKKEMNIMTLGEFKRFITYEDNDIYKFFFYMLYYTGMRKGEIFALNWEDINIDENYIKISKTLSLRRGSKIENPKTDKSNREIKMIRSLYNLIKPIKKDHGRVFENGTITATTLRRKCINGCKKADIDRNIRIHDFRHSFASLCIDNDVPIAVLSEYLGHENISTTLDIYGHLYPNSQDKLLTKLAFI